MNLQQKTRKPLRPYNRVVRAGLWVTIISAALWAGGRLINQIALYLPFAVGVGITLMVVGLIIQFQRAKHEAEAIAE